ncbi:DoxX family protein [Streptomyces gamaensis]|uniref:DoxX family protein n=1 Tax=Streptomyces gamaensis TaxID=1763542 RepID=A0ABW0YVV7_9ACTN
MISTGSRFPSAPSLTTAPAPSSSPAAVDAGQLLLRLMTGLIMTAHGTGKLFGWFGGSGLDATGQYFTAQHYPAGKVMAVLAGLSETLGGLGLALGLLTPLAAAAILGVMINALVVKWHGGFYAPTGVEYELLLAVAATSIALTGPGRIAADRFLPVLRRHRLSHGIAAVVLAAVAATVLVLIRD